MALSHRPYSTILSDLQHLCLYLYRLVQKLRKRQILPVSQNLSPVHFSLAKFQLVSCNPSILLP